MCSAALMAIADHFDNMPIRSYAAEVRRQGLVDAGPVFGNLLGAQDQITVASNQMEQVDLNLPPGLDNLRNTCYLNSILQYLYTVTPVRELVLNYDPTAAGLSDDLANQNDEVYLGRECRCLASQPSLVPALTCLQSHWSSSASSKRLELLRPSL